MKFKFLFLLVFLFLGVPQMEAQIFSDQKPTDGGPIIKQCASLVVVNQECQDDGTVTLSFLISNNTLNNVNYVRISDGQGWNQNINTNIGPLQVGSLVVTYTGAAPESLVCFTVKLYSPEVGLCCFSKVCIRVRDCPCASLSNQSIECVPNSANNYEYCFTVNNPASSTNTINEITFFSDTPDLCLNNTPLTTTIGIPPIPPGSSDEVCVILRSCNPNQPLLDGVDIELDIYLEDSNDLAYCCHMNDKFTTPCCDGDLDCVDYDIHETDNFWPPWGDETEEIIEGISDVNTTINFVFMTQGVPDQLVVTIDGNIVLDSQPWSTDGHTSCGFPVMGIYTGSVNVKECDLINVTVYGDPTDCGSTGWTLDMMCAIAQPNPPYQNKINLSTFDIQKQRFDEDQNSEEAYNRNAERSIPSAEDGLTIFPNPVQDVLNITNADSAINYESVRVMDASGKVLLSENMSGRSDLQIDATRISQGTYLLELIDAEGNKTVEKFVKF